MARLKLKQVLSNISYNEGTNQLTITGTSDPSLIVSGSMVVADTPLINATLTIEDVDTFGDSGSFDQVDLGENDF